LILAERPQFQLMTREVCNKPLSGFCRRFDVLINTEDVVRIVLTFDARQPRVLITVSGLDALFALFHEIMHINSAGRKRLQPA